MSGETAAPWGEGSTVRAMGWPMSHSSTFMMNHTATFAPSGKISRGRSKMGENSARGLGMGMGLRGLRNRHCEGRSDVAISLLRELRYLAGLPCFARNDKLGRTERYSPIACIPSRARSSSSWAESGR